MKVERDGFEPDSCIHGSISYVKNNTRENAINHKEKNRIYAFWTQVPTQRKDHDRVNVRLTQGPDHTDDTFSNILPGIFWISDCIQH